MHAVNPVKTIFRLALVWVLWEKSFSLLSPALLLHAPYADGFTPAEECAIRDIKRYAKRHPHKKNSLKQIQTIRVTCTPGFNALMPLMVHCMNSTFETLEIGIWTRSTWAVSRSPLCTESHVKIPQCINFRPTVKRERRVWVTNRLQRQPFMSCT